MKRLLNTLYVTTQGAYLARAGMAVNVRVEEETVLRVPIHTLGGIVCFGRVSCSPALMRLCGENDVTISHLSIYGRFYARVEGPVSGNVLLRREQYRRADDPVASAGVAQFLIAAKIANSRTVLLRALRDHAEKVNEQSLQQAADELANILAELAEPVPLDVIRGCEGRAARAYFSVFDQLITSQKDDFFFRERSRRPPLDNMNSLLSFYYTLLVHDVSAALETVGLDPQVGFLHRDRPGRPGLALDLMEELRPILADRLALSLVNRRQLSGADFTTTESGAVVISDDARKEVLVAYQERKQDEIQHPFLEQKIAIGLLPHAQALLLARYLRGDLDAYPAYFWR